MTPSDDGLMAGWGGGVGPVTGQLPRPIHKDVRSG